MLDTRLMLSTLWLVSLAVVVALTTMPWSNYVGYSQGNRVKWIPSSDHGRRAAFKWSIFSGLLTPRFLSTTDICANLLDASFLGLLRQRGNK